MAVSPYGTNYFMAWNNNGGERQRNRSIFHSELVKRGGTNLTIKSAPRWVKNNTMCVCTVVDNGEECGLFIDSEQIEEALKSHVGQEVFVIASGSKKAGDAMVVIQPVGQGHPAPAQRGFPQQQTSQPTSHQPATTSPSANIRDAKVFFCQGANLMRLAVKKANDIAVELGLPNEHRQGMATTFFIQAERAGLLSSMPVDPFTPEELGWGASSQPSQPEPAQQQEDPIPF
jgi:hypothetical protein